MESSRAQKVGDISTSPFNFHEKESKDDINTSLIFVFCELWFDNSQEVFNSIRNKRRWILYICVKSESINPVRTVPNNMVSAPSHSLVWIYMESNWKDQF